MALGINPSLESGVRGYTCRNYKVKIQISTICDSEDDREVLQISPVQTRCCPWGWRTAPWWPAPSSPGTPASWSPGLVSAITRAGAQCWNTSPADRASSRGAPPPTVGGCNNNNNNNNSNNIVTLWEKILTSDDEWSLMVLFQIESLKRVIEGCIYVKFKISFDEFVLVNIVQTLFSRKQAKI